ncbi:MAG: hypothetical protein WD872_17615, partial [Pirellulaceae bacterium]
MTITRYPMIGAHRVVDPGELYAAHAANGWPTDFYGLANSISCPVGMEPGSAWFLVSRATGGELGVNSTHSLKWVHENGPTTWLNYILHRAVLVGIDGDGKAPYLLEFRDKRQVLRLSSIDKEYNVRRTTRGYDTATT